MRAVMAVLMSFLAAWQCAGQDAGRRPNVLFIGTDDLRVELGCYGETLVESPNIDRLAQRGLLFGRAYCQQALCNPSRASMLTGLRPDMLGVTDLPTHFREGHPDVVTLPQLFKQHGYFTQDIGKIFHNWAQPEHPGDPESWSVPEVLHYAQHNDDKPLVEGEVPPNLSDVPRTECREVPDEAYFDGRIAKLAIESMEAHKDEPFFLPVGFWKPHLPFNPPKKYWDMYAPEADLPANPAPPEGVPGIALHDSRELMRGFDAPLTEQQVRTLRRAYYAGVSFVDAQVGKLLDALDRLGLRENTIVVFCSDHGFHLGEHDLWCKTSNFELDARVPLIISAPGQAGAGRRTEALAELVDLYPTLAELCGLPAPGNLEGVSLRPLLDDPGARVKDAAFTQHPRPAYPPGRDDPKVMGYSMRTERYRYTEWREIATGELAGRELYDHARDPRETNNVIDAPEMAGAVETLSGRLARQAPPKRQDSASERPNIVFILVDDLGWMDTGFNGGRIRETPRLDQLASEGMRFTRAYAPAPICSASRASILTGKSPARLHFEFVTKYLDSVQNTEGLALKPPPFTLNLPLTETCIPEALGPAGYETGFFGKWHVAAHHERYLGWSPTHGPLQQGFDVAEEDFGMHPYNKEAQLPPKSYAEGEFPQDSMTDRAIRFIQEQAKKGPFYLQVNEFYVHSPVESQAAWLTKKFAAKLEPGEPARHAEFAAFTAILDHNVGRILDAILEEGIEKNTLVVFSSDNGGDPRYSEHAPLRGHKWTLYEGGVRVPMLVRWPDAVAAGSVCDTPVILSDLFSTFASAAGRPANSPDGRDILPLLLGKTAPGLDSRQFYWHFPYYHPEEEAPGARHSAGINDPDVPFLEPQSAMLVGNTKVVYFHERDVVEIYDLRQDPSEQHDLSAEQPERAARLKAELMRTLRDADARLPVRQGG